MDQSQESDFLKIKHVFEKISGLKNVRFSKKISSVREAYVIEISNPSTRFYDFLQDAIKSSEVISPPPIVIKSSTPINIISSSEGKLFLKTITESQNVNIHTFERDFFDHYITSVSGAEEQIISSANHIVMGRRGAGKSMLLLYAWHTRKSDNSPSIWIDMQVYSRRNDITAAKDILAELIDQCSELIGDYTEKGHILSLLDESDEKISSIRKILPKIRKYLAIASKDKSLFIFLDDFHAIGQKIQPLILDLIYATTRGNKCFLKISAIETIINNYSSTSNEGLQVPHDAQSIKLDYNLTSPDLANEHLNAIFDSYARISGINSVRRMCVSSDVIPRLTWVAAGVPRDALNIFAIAISKATVEGKQRVAVSHVNIAASEMITTKLKEVEADSSGQSDELLRLTDKLKSFCVEHKRKNAFLVENENNSLFQKNLRKLINLRVLHVISEGITIGKAGQKYIGLILDYGFYTGIRAAQSVDLFNKKTSRVSYKELRALPVFKPDK